MIAKVMTLHLADVDPFVRRNLKEFADLML
jgi:hypothetical protein